MPHAHEHDQRIAGIEPPQGLGSRGWIVLAGFAVAAAYFLWTEHRAHVIQFLPWAFLALCPLMHVFMHHGHGTTGDRSDDRNRSGGRGAR